MQCLEHRKHSTKICWIHGMNEWTSEWEGKQRKSLGNLFYGRKDIMSLDIWERGWWRRNANIIIFKCLNDFLHKKWRDLFQKWPKKRIRTHLRSSRKAEYGLLKKKELSSIRRYSTKKLAPLESGELSSPRRVQAKLRKHPYNGWLFEGHDFWGRFYVTTDSVDAESYANCPVGPAPHRHYQHKKRLKKLSEHR